MFSAGSRSRMVCDSATESASLSLRMLTLSAGRPSERAMVVASTERTATSATEASLTGRSVAGTYQPATCRAVVGVWPTWMASSVLPR